ncbi:phosphodiester glycosidase family protein [Frischella perrara]|uniref:phosphodiester glycosidase family protein n=1 Tax=Frischella perrara TaxID=1267021 RepID=UPI0023F32913|nr:phosphodiester glycosidase family protein [Frischella perrara]
MNSLQEYDKKSNIFSVKDFGAVGNGLQDDTLAITKAIDETYKNGGILLFPSGTYIISSDIELKREFISTGAVSFQAPDNGDLPPSVVFFISRRMNVSNVTFNNIIVKIAPKDKEQIYTPVEFNGVNFLHSPLQIGQSRTITSGYSIRCCKFSSYKSRAFNGLTVLNANHVLIDNCEFQEFLNGIYIEPTMSFAASEIRILNTRIANCVDSGISLIGSSTTRLSKIILDNLVITGSLRDRDILKRGGIRAYFCNGLMINNITASTITDTLKLEACSDVKVHNSNLTSNEKACNIRATGCVNVDLFNCVFDRAIKTGYAIIIGNANLNAQTKGNTYPSKFWRIHDCSFHCLSSGIKIEYTDSISVFNNKFYTDVTETNTGLIWFSKEVTNGQYFNNEFYAPGEIKTIRNDSSANVTNTYNEQKLNIIKPSIDDYISEPIIKEHDSDLNEATSYLIEFRVNNYRKIQQAADINDFKTISDWMKSINNATLAWNSCAWHVASKKLGDIVVNGTVYDTYGTENFWWARSMLVIDRYNSLTCRDFSTPSYSSNNPLMIASASIAENAWQTAIFRAPLVVDGEVYDPLPNKLLDYNGWFEYLSARMCLGQKKDGSYILLAVDGKSGFAGCTMEQVARKMKDLGCIHAFNLDGGGSASLWYKGKVINKPSLGEGERKIPAIMYI